MSKNGNKKSPKPKRPKTRLGLPDLDHSKTAVLDSLPSRESKRGYRHAIDEFIQWYCSEPRPSFNKVVLTRYRIFLENLNLAARFSTRAGFFPFRGALAPSGTDRTCPAHSPASGDGKAIL